MYFATDEPFETDQSTYHFLRQLLEGLLLHIGRSVAIVTGEATLEGIQYNTHKENGKNMI
jgi:hypothetical protein